MPVHVTLLCGDRDAAAERIVGRRRERQPVVVGRAWDDGRVSVRHGDEFDPACRTAGGSPPGRHREPTLAESIRVDLVGRFAAEAAGTAPAAARLARGLAAAGTDALASVLAAWARSSAGAAGPRPHGVDDAWRRCVNAWWRGARTVVPSSACEFDVVDALAAELDRGLGGDVPPSAPLLDGLRARPPRGSSGLVLGHPRHPGGGTLAICLGAGAVAGPPGPPPLLACPATAGWPRWQRLLPEDERSAVVAIGAARPVAADGGAVVDAA